MEVNVFESKREMGVAAASAAAANINSAIRNRGAAAIILATGASQFEMLEALVQEEVDWSKVTVFHLDEYVGLPVDHPASFRGYLLERFVERVPDLGQFHPVNGDAGDPYEECARLGELIRGFEIDVACVGIGENAHLAFNDPPADFETEEPYIVVDLDAACRAQQVGEGWFGSLSEVPVSAISMSIRQIMRTGCIICTVPDERKALALKRSLEGPITPEAPASILQQHDHCHVFADQAAASMLGKGS
jgi:glucosamine-6-phosphate deaminase